MIDLYDWYVISSRWIKPPGGGSRVPAPVIQYAVSEPRLLCSAAPDLDASRRSSRVSLRAPPLCSAAFPEPSTFLDRAGAASLSSSASQHSNNKELIDWESRAQPPPPPPAATPVARLQPQGVGAADAQWLCGPLVLRRSLIWANVTC